MKTGNIYLTAEDAEVLAEFAKKKLLYTQIAFALSVLTLCSLRLNIPYPPILNISIFFGCSWSDV